MGPISHPKFDREDPPEFHVPYSQFIPLHYTTSRVPHLDLHPVPHQIFVHYRYWGNKLTNTNYRRGTYGRTRMH